MPREPSRAERGTVRRKDLGVRRESFNASRETLKVDIVSGRKDCSSCSIWISTSTRALEELPFIVVRKINDMSVPHGLMENLGFHDRDISGFGSRAGVQGLASEGSA